jgi:hypothetical protein
LSALGRTAARALESGPVSHGAAGEWAPGAGSGAAG